MAIHEQRLLKLRAHVGDARDELHALPAKDRKAFRSELARLEEVVADAGAVLDVADGRLLPTAAFAAVQAAACAIANDPRSALGAPDAHADALAEAIALLPVTRKEIERQVLAAADALQTATGNRLHTLRLAVDAEAERLQGLASEVEQWSAQVELHGERQAALDAKLATTEAAIAEQRRAVDEHRARQTEVFADGERGRAAQFEAQLELFRGELARVQQEATDEVTAHLVEIRRMEQESAKLVGAIGLAGTTELYRRQGNRHQLAAELLRGFAVLAVLGAVALALAGTMVADPTVETLGAGAFASLLLAGLAAYLARQSARHRAREERAAAVELELAAFGPFIEPLSAERREQERVIMARKLFGTADLDGEPAGAATRHADDQGEEGARNGRSRASASDSAPAVPARAVAANGAGTNGSPAR